MPDQLRISVGQYSDKGRKDINQDFHGVYIPEEPLLTSKGIVIALADGISSSAVSQIASEATVTGFLEDYYCTSDAWSVKKSAQRVLVATNSWLFSQTQHSQYRYDKDRGYVCTLSAMVIKSTTAHIFHLGDTRIYQLSENNLEQLTNDHRLWVSENKSYLSRAMGINSTLEIDYDNRQVVIGDVFLFLTDGVYEFVSNDFIIKTIGEFDDNLDKAAQTIVQEAYQQGSTDNLTAQIIRIDEQPSSDANETYQQLAELPFPPILEARANFDGYTIIRELHGSSRSHVYLAMDNQANTQVVLKTPSIDLQGNPAYLERFLMEEWIARRINSAHVLKPCAQTRKRHFIYLVTEFIDGQTLTQWMIDHPKPDLETVRGIIEQIAKGLRAFHRLEMLHQDIRPENIMIDHTGTVKIIDFGSTRVAGLSEMTTPIEQENILGTAQYTAPEYFLGDSGTPGSDLFSLGVIAYQMLSGKLPYGAKAARATSKAAQMRLIYESLTRNNRQIPTWIDGALRKAVHPDPFKRYQELSEFLFDMRHPNKEFINANRPPLLERNPVIFWKGVSVILLIIIVFLLSQSP
ncbi:MAG TPA: bifunctional protein-serine/threonine kinase/phosphatase [Crenotrichaceae bacterium]|nr:bifunctional protein-serine/threonine kinase/phosphatase [Crenotrichaceae bacterium]